MIDLEGIRARDAGYVHPEVHDLIITPEDIGEPYVGTVYAYRDRRALLQAYDELLAAAGEVTCFRCGGTGLVARIETTVTNTEHSASASSRWVQDSCESCADLRRLMKEAGR